MKSIRILILTGLLLTVASVGIVSSASVMENKEPVKYSNIGLGGPSTVPFLIQRYDACLDFSILQVMVNKIGYHQFIYPLNEGIHNSPTAVANSPPVCIYK